MYWNVDENEPQMAGRGYTILLDGEGVPRVTEFDTDEGWLVKHCQGEKGEEHPDSTHLSLEGHREPCTVRLEGHIEVVAPNGEVEVEEAKE